MKKLMMVLMVLVFTASAASISYAQKSVKCPQGYHLDHKTGTCVPNGHIKR